jgi:hypothetical protein
MASKLKRLTFVVTPEMEPLLDGIKKEMFYNCSQSEMIRILVEEGWNAIKKDGNQHNQTKLLQIQGSIGAKNNR